MFYCCVELSQRLSHFLFSEIKSVLKDQAISENKFDIYDGCYRILLMGTYILGCK